MLILTPLAAHAQSGQGNPNGGSNNPEQSAPVVLTVSVAPDRVPITSGTATLTWSGQNARYCSVDGVSRAASGSATVGPWTTAGAKSILVECWNNGKAGYAASTVTVTVYNVAKPVITTTLSKSLLEANVDKFTVTYSATNAKSCMLAGTKYPTSGSATLGPYPAGKHSLTFSCSGDGGSTSHTINWEAIKAVTLSASVSPSTITANGSDKARVTWTGANADSCTLDGATAVKSGSKDFGPYSYSEAGTKSATVACKNRLGSKSSKVNWTVDALAPVVSATLSQNPVIAGVDKVDLSWTSSNTDDCSYGGRTRSTSGKITGLGPFNAGKEEFTVSCTGAGGTTSDTVTLTVNPPPEAPTVTVSLNPARIPIDTGTSTLSWSSANATSCTYDNATVAVKGSSTLGPYDTAGDYSIEVTCMGDGGSDSDAATLTVEPAPKPPVVRASLDPTTITAGAGTSTLSWSSVRAASCEVDGTSASTSGDKQVGPYAKGAYTFTVSCTGDGGTDSDTETLTVVALPTVSVSLSKSTITAGKDKVEMTWSSTDATACQYGSTALSTDGTREIGPFAEGAHDVIVSCTGAGGTASETARLTAVKDTGDPDTDGDGTVDSLDTDDDNDGMPDACEIRYGFNPLDASDGGSANTDGDGASNAHECKHGTDPTRTPAETILPDTDGDGMPDAWEWNHGLDPDDADDKDHDTDGDGYNNLEEYTARTDPRWDESHPKSVPELSSGFNDSYTVHVGQIDSGDMLKDILVRNPTKNVLPAISDFVLIQQEEGGYAIEAASKHTIPSNLTDISDDAEFVDINADGATDLVITGLGDHIAGANDRVVYGNVYERHAIPARHVSLAPETNKFFKELSAWVDDDKYFIKNAKKVSVPKIVRIDLLRDSQNRIIARKVGGDAETPLRDSVSTGNNCFENPLCLPVKDECETGGSFFCYVFTGDLSDLSGINSGGDPCASSGITCVYGADPLAHSVMDVADDPNEDNFEAFVKFTFSPTLKVTARDFSGFNQDAWLLASRMLQPLRAEDAVLTPGTRQAEVISRTLGAYLDAPVLNNRLLGAGNGVLPQVADPDDYDGDSAKVLESMEFVRDKIALPDPQNQITEEERNNSPNLDIFGDSNFPQCDAYENLCNEGSFSDEQIEAIDRRIQELQNEFIFKGFPSADAAAIALHDSELYKFAQEIGIEVYAIIDTTSIPVRIRTVGTGYRTGDTGEYQAPTGSIIWHNHPSLRPIWPNDLILSLDLYMDDICQPGVDYTVYASGARLTRAKVKQIIDITDPATFVFRYEARINQVWEEFTTVGLRGLEPPADSCN